jgi:hypothetical protein
MAGRSPRRGDRVRGPDLFIIVVGTASGIDPGGALGLGIFAGAFGGTGFGYMVGAIVTFGRDFDSQLIPTNDDHTRGE